MHSQFFAFTNFAHSRFSFPLTCAFRALTHIWFLDYVQASVLADSIRTVALQIDQYPVEAPPGPPGTIGTLGEVVVVQLILAAIELLFRRFLQTVSHSLQDDTYPSIQRRQMRFPQDRCNGIDRQRFSHPFRQCLRTIVEQQQRLER